MNHVYLDHPTAFQVILGFISLLYRKSSALFLEIFEELQACCSAARERVATKALMIAVTDSLNGILHEVDALDQFRRSTSPAVSLAILTERTLIDHQRSLVILACSPT